MIYLLFLTQIERMGLQLLIDQYFPTHGNWQDNCQKVRDNILLEVLNQWLLDLWRISATSKITFYANLTLK